MLGKSTMFTLKLRVENGAAGKAVGMVLCAYKNASPKKGGPLRTDVVLSWHITCLFWRRPMKKGFANARVSLAGNGSSD
jgi:hypothetical protein